jgi:acyl carrier protein
MNPIEKNLRQFVVETFLFGTDDGDLTNHDSFIDKGLIDSMGILNLVSYVESTYRIQVADVELVPEIWDSISTIADFIASKEVAGVAHADVAYAR